MSRILKLLLLDVGFEQVLKKKPDFREKPWPSITQSAQDFVKKLLVKDPHMRLTAAQALCKPLLIPCAKFSLIAVIDLLPGRVPD